MFFLGSFLSALLFGVAIGNAVMGLAIGADKEFQGGLLELLNPYALTVGLFTVLLFALHGAMFLIVKTEGQQQKQIQKIAKVLFIAFLVAYFLVTGLTLYLKPEMVANFSFGKVSLPGGSHELVTSYQTTISIVTWILVVANFLAILNISRALWKGKEMLGFLSSSANIAALVSLFALGIFPNMLVSTLNPDWSLTIYNASSSDYTLRTMFFLALIGMPFVIAYTSIIYWTYRGKTELTDSSY
jgi:cytochrome d ubiquinol oxidase subunit II